MLPAYGIGSMKWKTGARNLLMDPRIPSLANATNLQLRLAAQRACLDGHSLSHLRLDALLGSYHVTYSGDRSEYT